MTWVTVQSSFLWKIGYNPISRVLGVSYLNGAMPSYYGNVPQIVFDGFVNARSPGSFYNSHVRGKYERVGI